MYEMKKCPKCSCEDIVEGKISGSLPECEIRPLKGVWGLKTFTCLKCGFVELSVNADEKNWEKIRAAQKN